MFPMGMVCGNTYVMKPSEQDPESCMMLVELAHEAGIPPGMILYVELAHKVRVHPGMVL